MSEKSDSRTTRTSLLDRAMDHDAVAWAELVDLYGPLIAHWCAKCGLDSHLAADCTQDVFSVLAKKLDTFRPQRGEGSFRSWLWTITSNKIKDRLRIESRMVQGSGGSTAMRTIAEIPDLVSIPDKEPSDEIQVSALVSRGLAQIRTEFTEKTWRLFERSVIDDIATTQVAQEYDVTPATVRQSRSRILRRLREHLGDQ